MKPVDQSIVDGDDGDCMRAAVASLFEWDLVQVPHFIRFDDWWWMFYWFLWGAGWHLHGSRRETSDIGNWDGTIRFGSIPETYKGCVLASVMSRTFEGESHSVVMQTDGLVVHDPNPNKAWQGENIIKTGQLLCWDLILPRVDDEEE